MDEKQQKILNVFRYVPATDSVYWTPALKEATVETLEYALAHRDEHPVLGKVKIKKIEAWLARLKKAMPAADTASPADRTNLSEIERAVLEHLLTCDKPVTVGRIQRMFTPYMPGIPDIQSAIQKLTARGLVRHFAKMDSDRYAAVRNS